jgi:Uma2 family endonuclease
MRRSQRHYPIEEYFVAEQMSPFRHEYFAGEIFVMAGGSRNHDRLAGNVYAAFLAALRGSACEAFTSNMRVRTPSGLYTYPDASIVCGPPDIVRIQGTETIGNPVVLVEVLSESTGDYDRGQKFELYQSISTLRDYVLIEQSRIEVEHRHLNGDGGWSSTTISGIHASVPLTGVELELPLALVYERVTF